MYGIFPFCPIFSERCKEQEDFLKACLGGFKNELLHYINQNSDPDILGYCNEMTLASLFVSGFLRAEAGATAIQEYGVSDSSGRYGRPDIFINYKKRAIWIEAKFSRASFIDHNNHWDIKKWLEWDNAFALQQAEDYYLIEKKHVNKTYENGHYVMSLIFKEINEHAIGHIRKAEEKLRPNSQFPVDRAWYYDLFLLTELGHEGNSRGIEIYGTFKKMEEFPTATPNLISKENYRV